MEFTTIYKFLNFLSPSVLLIGISIGIYYFRNLNILHKGITYYLLVMLCVDILSRILQYYLGNNLVLLLVYSLIEMIMFIYFYYKYLFKSRHIVVAMLCCVAILYIIWELFYITNNVRQFQSYSKVVDNFIIIMLALAFLSEKINEYKESRLDSFYINAVILIFFSINLIFFLPLNFILNEKTGLYFWLLNLITTVSFYLYLTYSILKSKTNKLSQ